MVSTDPIADMLTRIRNAIGVNKNEVVVPYSKMKERVAAELANTGFIDSIDVQGEGVKQLRIVINQPDTNARIAHIERVSSPGRRLYAKADTIPVVKNGRGLVIVSTPKGVMSGREAAKQRLGGELICTVY